MRVDGCAGTFPIWKHFPPSSQEEALPLFELEVGIWVALSREGSVGLMERQQGGAAAPCTLEGLVPGQGILGHQEDLSTVFTSHLQEHSFCWFLQPAGCCQPRGTVPAQEPCGGTALMEQSN